MYINRLSKLTTFAIFGASMVVLNNCGKDTLKDSSADIKDQSELATENADFYAGIAPVFRTPIASPAPVYQVTETNCNDGSDNDGDGLVDCMDTDCHIHPECAEFGPPLEEVVNSRASVVHPNGLLTVEDIAILNARPADDDDGYDWLANGFFATRQKDCWIDPRVQDPYYFIPLGEALVAGPSGAIGPQLNPATAISYYGPRAGLINECEYGTDIMFHHVDDDNGPGAGANGDTHANENDDDAQDVPTPSL